MPFVRPTELTALQDDLGVYGDDMDELLLAFSKRFAVDLSGCRWYFHTGEEGFNPVWLLFPPPNRRVEEIPITIGMLHRFAEFGRWAVEYPPHRLPRFRLDVLLGWLIAAGILGVMVCIGLKGCGW